MAERLQAQEQEELSIEEKATLFQKLLDERRKHFVAKRAEEKRNKPPTKAQQRKIICTYLKNMEGYKLNDLKLKEFDSIQKIFDRAFKRQKVEDDKETTEIKKLMEIIPDEEVAIHAIPLAVKSPSIVDWKIHKEGRKSYYQIRVDGKSQIPVEDLDLVLWIDLKIMFEPHVEDKVWRNQQNYKVLNWKLYDSCGVHFLRMQHMKIYMLAEKKYPLTPSTPTMMLEKKLMIDYESEMAYQLLKLIIKQLKNLLDAVRITAAQVYVNTALMKLVLLMDFKENMLSLKEFDLLKWDRQVLTEFYESVGISHQKSVPRTPQQKGVLERRNCTLVEGARTMLIFSKVPMFLWAEAIATACYTQNRFLIHTRHNKTPYELVHDKKPDLTFLCIFGALCYPTNDSEDVGKLKEKQILGFLLVMLLIGRVIEYTTREPDESWKQFTSNLMS
ncbi:ribonuclease H-like domain-containing protein [Tanacetum coccineum]